MGMVAMAALESYYACTCSWSRQRLARETVRQVAAEAYARWTLDHLDRRCPDSALELANYSGDREMRDPWGTTFVVLCGDDSAYGMRVVSAGPDGAFGTRDDNRSWEEP